jgi:hypothetical protein
VSWFTGLLPVVSKLGGSLGLLAVVITLLIIAPLWLTPKIRTFLIWAAVVLGYGFAAYGVGVHDENSRWSRWYKAALKAETQNGSSARANAEHYVDKDQTSQTVVTKDANGNRAIRAPNSVRLDKRNRDNWKRR